MTDIIDLSFDYWYKCIKEKKKEQDRKENVKKYFENIKDNRNNNDINLKKSSII